MPQSGPRLFVAAEVSARFRSAYEAVRAQWDRKIPGARWTRPEGVHLTLKFLGAVAEERVAAIDESLSVCASLASPFELKTAGPGLFGSAAHPRVLWIALEGETGRAEALVRSLDEAMTGLGFAPEDRPFRPHLTLARFDPQRKARIPDQLSGAVSETLSGLPLPVAGFVLFQSLLGRGGSQYIPQRRFSLTLEAGD